MTAAERGIRRRQRLFVVFTAVLVLAYARQLVNAPTAGQDFRAFFAAARLATPMTGRRWVTPRRRFTTAPGTSVWAIRPTTTSSPIPRVHGWRSRSSR